MWWLALFPPIMFSSFSSYLLYMLNVPWLCFHHLSHFSHLLMLLFLTSYVIETDSVYLPSPFLFQCNLVLFLGYLWENVEHVSLFKGQLILSSKVLYCQVYWYSLVTLPLGKPLCATQWDSSQEKEKSSTLSVSHSKDVAHLVECLPGIYKALGLIPTNKTKTVSQPEYP